MLNLILSAVPVIGKLIAAGQGNDVIATGTKIAKELFGTDKEEEILQQMQTNPALAEQFKARIEAESREKVAAIEADTEKRIAEIADVQAARMANNQLATSGHAGYWSGPVIDTVVVTGFFGVLFTLLVRPVQMSVEMLTMLNVMLGFLGNNFAQIINYHRGSSAGSANKDRLIQAISADNTVSNAKIAAKVVEAAKK